MKTLKQLVDDAHPIETYFKADLELLEILKMLNHAVSVADAWADDARGQQANELDYIRDYIEENL